MKKISSHNLSFFIKMIINRKVVIIGDSSVGKTSIAKRYIYNSIESNHEPTVGIDFFQKIFEKNETQYKLQIYDTAGQEKFGSLIPSYLRDSSVAVFVFDITKEETFENLEKWISLVLNKAKPVFIFVGNKSDLEEKREVEAATGEEIAKKYKGKYFETSALLSTNIKELFDYIIDIPPTDIECGQLSEKKSSTKGLQEQENQRPININQSPAESSTCSC